MNISKRRDFFKYMAALGLVTFSVSPLEAKLTKSKIKYQDTPKYGSKCEDCLQFIPETNECKIVEGTISPNGWCTVFVKNPNK
ncbi:MAG: high-potential iron-sulfur protein [Arcobacteraceae bacterium]|nr:high-potential iron-sulfur protein [Arcobacteraceae bacterium]